MGGDQDIDALKAALGIDVARATSRPKGPGYVPVMLFDGQAEGAIPNGTLIEKCNKEGGDAYDNGTFGTVLSSMYIGDMDERTDYCYFVDWLPDPGVPVMILGHRIKVA
jgi:hypothetical protein